MVPKMTPSFITCCTSVFDNFGVHFKARSGSEREPKIALKPEPFPTSFQGFLAPTRSRSPNSGGPGMQENQKSSWPFIYKYILLRGFQPLELGHMLSRLGAACFFFDPSLGIRVFRVKISQSFCLEIGVPSMRGQPGIPQT